MPRKRAERVLVLWNAVGPDPYESLPPEIQADIGTEKEEFIAVVDAVAACGYRAKGVNIAEDLDALHKAIRSFRPDAILNLIEFFNDQAVQEAYIAGLFELMKIPYTGAGPLCLLTCQRKGRTKRLLEAQGVPTPQFRLVQELPMPRQHGLRYPLIVKPAREDASGGIHANAVVHDLAELEAQVERTIAEYHQPVLIERYIEGREIHVSILGNDPPEVLPLLELEFEETEGDEWKPKILTYEAKWDPLSPDFHALDVQVPARRLPRPVGNRIREVAQAAYRIMGCRDYARIDIRLDEDSNPYVLEVNPNPNLAAETGFMLCAEKSGRTFSQTIGELVAMALARGPAKPAPARARAPRKQASRRKRAPA